MKQTAKQHEWYLKNRERISLERKTPEYRAYRNENKKRYNATDYGKLAQKSRFLKWRYGITHYQYEILMLCQGGACIICGVQMENEGDMHIDHDHETGEIRGLLSDRCNRGLGFFDENPSLLREAAEYLAT